jgi:clan AA aspartic protease
MRNLTGRLVKDETMEMGETRVPLKVTNLFSRQAAGIHALVDTGSTYLTVTEAVARELGFDPAEFTMRRVVVADGRSVRVPLIGPIQIDFEDRSCRTEAYVMGDQCLLGFIPLEAMDLVVDPGLGRLVGRHPGGPLHRA